MFSGFNGDYRRAPVVSIRGSGNAAKKETRTDLVQRLKEERAQREVEQKTRKCLPLDGGVKVDASLFIHFVAAASLGELELRQDPELRAQLPRPPSSAPAMEKDDRGGPGVRLEAETGGARRAGPEKPDWEGGRHVRERRRTAGKEAGKERGRQDTGKLAQIKIPI
jgi:hypothetical protein